jgi:hypothetical protein
MGWEILYSFQLIWELRVIISLCIPSLYFYILYVSLWFIL